MARQAKDGSWYIGALTNWEERDMELDLSFLGEEQWKAEIFCDGINADRAARDFKHLFAPLNSADPFTFHMAPGGGFVMHLTR